jgi:K+-transporting ATPase ATPase B chain
VAENGRVLGAIALTDIVKGGMKERFDHLRAMGIRTMMITGQSANCSSNRPPSGRRRFSR